MANCTTETGDAVSHCSFQATNYLIFDLFNRKKILENTTKITISENGGNEHPQFEQLDLPLLSRIVQ